MNSIRKIVLTLLVLSLFMAVPRASAHRPEEGAASGVTAIPDPTTSYAYYREFGAGEFVHLYTVEGSAGQAFHAGINIPQLDGLQSYAVSLALLGPGLPEFDTARSFARSGADQGGIIVESMVTEDFFEPFTQTSYWGRQSLDITFPEEGTYTLVVWQPDERPGKYVLDTGREEVFTTGDLFRFPVWWWETRAYFDQVPSLWALGLAGLAVLGGAVFLLRRRALLKQEF